MATNKGLCEKLAKKGITCYYVFTMITKRQKENIVKKYGINKTDTGSPEVQVAILSKRIVELTSHLKKNRKDKHSRRGLLQMVADRQSHLKYLKNKNTKRYNSLLKKTGLKK